MISLEEAQAKLLALAPKPAPEAVPLGQAHGRYLLKPLIAKRTQPAADLSAMDGYAISNANLGGPWECVGESAAGAPFSGQISPSQCVRIFTGAVLPEGSDTIIIQEDCAAFADTISLQTQDAILAGQHVRKTGSDFTNGKILAEAGTAITPALIGLAIAAGHAEISVAKPVRLAILSTGNELIAPGEPTQIGQIPASNDVMLSALLNTPGVTCQTLGIVRDNLADLQSAIASAQDFDILITIGGASVGDHDLVRPALEAAGAKIDFWKVAMRPGKPIMAGKLGNQCIIGLPGNPVSAYVTAFLFAKPLISAILGSGKPIPEPQLAELGENLPPNGNRADHIRGRFENGKVLLTGKNDSAALATLAKSDCLIIRPPLDTAKNAGEFVFVHKIA